MLITRFPFCPSSSSPVVMWKLSENQFPFFDILRGELNPVERWGRLRRGRQGRARKEMRRHRWEEISISIMAQFMLLDYYFLPSPRSYAKLLFVLLLSKNGPFVLSPSVSPELRKVEPEDVPWVEFLFVCQWIWFGIFLLFSFSFGLFSRNSILKSSHLMS